MNWHGFPKACDHKYLFGHRLDRLDHRVDRFDHCLSKRCSALGCINTLADWSTFKSAAGTVSDSHPHSRACIKSNTHSYADSEPDTITKPSTCASASPAPTPPSIASHPAGHVPKDEKLSKEHARVRCVGNSSGDETGRFSKGKLIILLRKND